MTTSLHLAFIALVLNPAHVLTNAICAFRYQLIVNTPPVQPLFTGHLHVPWF